ncbi:arsenate reductase (glutaredoxin) [Reyranella sp. CPCC 100927]|uniref:arsenate reductase (glutaredoxin) n=1 Tax=Reyranella sp. CPCC 100927 TaxID=2599616 RepID=UPI0011B78375|nr:arsenate reductase (glutaredoxin) [Reyranella sp. CPCC 100927]TWT15761.1 arsenate reductase (glutaredoxin) [Reyranella sp. CPCC 100927]
MAGTSGAAVTIWHNPRCSKSRDTLALLREQGVDPVVREYLKEPPSRKEVETLLDLLGGEPRALLRDGEAEFKSTGRKAAGISRKDVVDLIAAHPVLLQRPVVVAGKKAAIGRPPEAVLKVIG